MWKSDILSGVRNAPSNTHTQGEFFRLMRGRQGQKQKMHFARISQLDRTDFSTSDWGCGTQGDKQCPPLDLRKTLESKTKPRVAGF